MAAPSAGSPGGDECPEEDEDEPEAAPDEAEAGGAGRGAAAGGGTRGAPPLPRRAVTLRVLLRDGLLEPARGVLSIYYLGKRFVGDLGADGSITWQETGQVFQSPSAWATHCKRLVNPAKKSGCGWASVRYKGQRLDHYKAAWLRQRPPDAPAADESLPSEGDEDELPEEDEEEAAPREGRAPEPPKKPEERSRKPQGRSPAEQPAAEQGAAARRPEHQPRVPVRYCTLGTRDAARNPQTLVEVTSFAAINKFQPFNVAIASNVLLLLDFHSHLTRSEVVGYLGGRWDTSAQLLTVLRAFPCRTRLGDAEAAAAVEEEICQGLVLRGLSLVGWYHSHPFGPPLPSLLDIDAQMGYQLRLHGGHGFPPCLALICGERRAPPAPGTRRQHRHRHRPRRALRPRQPRRGVPHRALLGDAAARAKAQRLRHPHGGGGGPRAGRLPHHGRAAGDDAARGVLQGRPGPGAIPGALEPGSDLPGQAQGLPGRADAQGRRLRPRPRADLRAPAAERLRGPRAPRGDPLVAPGPALVAPGAAPVAPGAAGPRGAAGAGAVRRPWSRLKGRCPPPCGGTPRAPGAAERPRRGSGAPGCPCAPAGPAHGHDAAVRKEETFNTFIQRYKSRFLGRLVFLIFSPPKNQEKPIQNTGAETLIWSHENGSCSSRGAIPAGEGTALSTGVPWAPRGAGHGASARLGRLGGDGAGAGAARRRRKRRRRKRRRLAAPGSRAGGRDGHGAHGAALHGHGEQEQQLRPPSGKARGRREAPPGAAFSVGPAVGSGRGRPARPRSVRGPAPRTDKGRDKERPAARGGRARREGPAPGKYLSSSTRRTKIKKQRKENPKITQTRGAGEGAGPFWLAPCWPGRPGRRRRRGMGAGAGPPSHCGSGTSTST